MLRKLGGLAGKDKNGSEDGRLPAIVTGNASGVDGTHLTGSILFHSPRDFHFLGREKNKIADADDLILRYVVQFTDGGRTECSSSDGALRLIAYRLRVKLADLVTDKTKEKIVVWIYPAGNVIAEVIVEKIHHRDTKVTESNR